MQRKEKSKTKCAQYKLQFLKKPDKNCHREKSSNQKYSSQLTDGVTNRKYRTVELVRL